MVTLSTLLSAGWSTCINQLVRCSGSVEQIDFSQPAVQLSTGEGVIANLVIGADGARSTYRESLLGLPDTPKPSGTLICRIYVGMDMASRHPEVAVLVSPLQIQIWPGRGAPIVCYGLQSPLNVVISQPEDDEGVSFDVRRVDLGTMPKFPSMGLPLSETLSACK